MVWRLLLLMLLGVVCFSSLPSASRESRPESVPSLPVEQTSLNELQEVAATDPVGLLTAAVRRYQQEVRGFRATLHKQERLATTLYPVEIITLTVREAPYAVRMIWQQGARAVTVGGLSLGTVEGALYVAGENQGQMVIWRPGAWIAPITTVSPVGNQARAASRYSLTEAGLGTAMERTRRAWAAARQRGQFHTEFLGTAPLAVVGGRTCHVWRRTCAEPECDSFLLSEPSPDPAQNPSEAFTTVTIMIDAETHHQIGSELRRADGELIGAYYFRDVELNPEFAPDEFQPTFRKR
jgi:hypothetical protein